MLFAWFRLESITAEATPGGIAAGSIEIGADQLEAAAQEAGDSTSLSAWSAFAVIDLVLAAAAVSALALLALSFGSPDPLLRNRLAAAVAGLGGLAAGLCAYRLADPPDLLAALGSVPSGFGVELSAEVGRRPAAFLGLLACAGIAYGAWRTLRANAPWRT